MGLLQPKLTKDVVSSKVMFSLIGLACGILGLICTVIILIEAFRDSALKGLICIFCGLYYIYYAIFEFQHENKLLLVLGSLIGGGVAGAINFLHL